MSVYCCKKTLANRTSDGPCGLAMDGTGSTTNINVRSSDRWTLLTLNFWTVIVCDNGRSGFLGEHSCLDGTATLRMNEFILGAVDHGRISASAGSGSTASLSEPKELSFEIDAKTSENIKQAENNFDKLIGDHELEVGSLLSVIREGKVVLKILHYDKYGSTQIKAHRTSPDAFAQLVKQLAFYKLYQRPGVTYESTQTRRYQKGRTEVTRSASYQSRDWVNSMTNPKVSVRTSLH